MMDYRVEKFDVAHYRALNETGATAYLNAFFTDEHARALAANTYSYTLFANGRVVFCGGLVEYWPGRAEAWGIFDEDCKVHFVKINSLVKKFLHFCPITRIEAAVDYDFKNGHRWVKALGFQLEAERLRAYRPDGGDCSLYSRIN